MQVPCVPNEREAWLCRNIVKMAQDAVVFSDRHGVIRLWNDGAERIFGFLAEEIIGQSMDIIIPDQLRERHWEGYRRVMSTGVTRYGSDLLAVPALRKDGRRISIEFTIVPIHGETGEMSGVASIIRDVTARWNRERAIRQRLAELESKIQ
jgi:PAS domain S-box-containing protein